MPDKIPRHRQLLYASIVVGIFFGTLELILRVYDFSFYYNFSADLLGMPILDLCRFRRIANQTVEFDPVVFWKFKPNQILDAKGVYRKPVRINNFGFRGRDFSLEKKPGAYRIICLGDSVTFGWSVGDEETYPAQLEKILQAKFPNREIEVINLGVTGYTSFQGKQLFQNFGKKLKPDLVIFGFGPNDRLPALYSDQELYEAKAWQKNKLDLRLSHSQIYKLLKAGVIYLERRKEGLNLNPKTYLPKLKRKVSPEEYEKNFAEIKKECDRLGCEVMLLNIDFPSLTLDPATEGLRNLAQKSGAQLPKTWQEWDSVKLNQKMALELGVKWLDLRALFVYEFPGERWQEAMVDNGHPNERGHRLIAENLARMIAEEQILNE